MATSAVTIKALTGPEFQLTLSGRALPYRGFRLKTSITNEKTSYQGNPESVLQVMTSDENNTTLTGKWSDKYIKPIQANATPSVNISFSQDPVSPEAFVSFQNYPSAVINGQSVEDVMDLVKQLDEFVRSAQAVEVTWDEITRHGLIESFEYNFLVREDVEWSLTFQWTSRGQPTTPIVLALQTGLEGAGTELQQQAQALTDALEQPPFPLLAEIAESFDEVQTLINQTSDQVQQSILNASQAILAPVDSARRTAAAMNSAVGQAGNMLTTIYGTSMSELRGFAQTGSVTVGQMYQAATFVNGLRATANAIRSQSRDRQEQLNTKLEADIVTTYVATGGENLRQVAVKFFGAADNWLEILKYNRLSSSVLNAGQKIRIPKSQPVLGRTV